MKVSLLAVLWILTVAFGYLLGLLDRPDPVALPALTQQSSKISLNSPVGVMGTKKKKSVIKKKKRVSKPKPKKIYGNVIQDASLNQFYYFGGYALIFGVFAVAIYFSQ